MKPSGITRASSLVFFGLAGFMGCAVPRSAQELSSHTHSFSPAKSAAVTPSHAEAPCIQPASLEQGAQQAPDVAASQSPFAQANELGIEDLVQQVLTRNPTLAQMAAAWQAASARHPQVTSLEDPMFGGTIGPASIGSREVDFAYRLEVSQKLPFHGKLGLRGQAASAEAAAAGNDLEDMRLQMIEAAKTAFYDYYLVSRALEVNEENLQRLREGKQNAETRVRNGQAPQQDLLQAEVEIGKQQERELTLRRMKEVSVARINTLMHLPPDSPLPPAPKQLKISDELPTAAALRATAISRRPDLQALAARLEAEQAALGLAEREYYPDFEVMAAYDAFWQPGERDLRPMLGLRMNLPVQKSRRAGAVSEAMAKLAQRRAELDRLTDQVNYQVQEAHAQVTESDKVVRLYEGTILPAAEANVKEALTAYATGKVPFLSLVEAQRNLVMLRDRHNEAVADFFRRRATLERAVGGPLVGAPATNIPSASENNEARRS